MKEPKIMISKFGTINSIIRSRVCDHWIFWLLALAKRRDIRMYNIKSSTIGLVHCQNVSHNPYFHLFYIVRNNFKTIDIIYLYNTGNHNLQKC
jgi:hypothetical protein